MKNDQKSYPNFKDLKHKQKVKEGKKLSIHMNTTTITYQVCTSTNISLVQFLLKFVKFH